MGTSYSPMPLGDIAKDEESLAWLHQTGLTLPIQMGPSRNPTPNEILAVVSGMARCEVDTSMSFPDLDIFVKCVDRIAIIWIQDFAPEHNNDAPRPFFFHRGDCSLVVEIVERLSCICGPFLLTDTNDFLIVQPGTTPADEWK